MPRNGSGSFSLAEAAFVPNTPISSAAVNSDLSDIADALTGSLARDGQGGMTAVLPLANTGFTYLTDPNTGMRRTAADTQVISAGGVDMIGITSTDVTIGGNFNVTGTFKIAGSAVFPITTANITDANVTYAKIQNVAASRILGNATGSPAAPAEIPISTGLSFVAGSLVGSLPLANAAGLVVTNNAVTPNSIIDVTADQAVMTTGSASIYAAAVSLSINTSATGANGIDAGARASSTWYNLFLISDGTTTAGLASLSATAPTMPGIYTYKVRIGVMRTDGSGNFLRTKQTGGDAQFIVTAATNTATLPVMVAEGGTITFWTALSVSNFVPPTATRIRVVAYVAQNAAAITGALAPNNSYPTSGVTNQFSATGFQATGLANKLSLQADMMLESTNIYYGGVVIGVSCQGWKDKVNAS